MSAAITTTSTTLAGQLLEVATAYNNSEDVYNTNNPTTPISTMQLSINTDTSLALISAQLPVTITTSSNGITVAAQNIT